MKLAQNVLLSSPGNYPCVFENAQTVQKPLTLKKSASGISQVAALQGFVWRVDKDYKILMASRKSAELKGMTVAEMIGQSGFTLYPTEAERYYADNLSVFESGQPILGILEPHSSTETGERRWMRTDKIPLFDENGNVESVLISAVDVTREIELQNKSSFRHRIRTPITSILGFAELIANGECVDSQEVEKFAKLILAQSHILLEVVEQITENGTSEKRTNPNLTSPSWINLNFFLQNWSSGAYLSEAKSSLIMRGRMASSCPAFLHVDTNIVSQILSALGDRASNSKSATFVDLFIDNVDSEMGVLSRPRIHFVIQDNSKSIPEDAYLLFLKSNVMLRKNDWLESCLEDYALNQSLLLAHKLAAAANGSLELRNSNTILGNKFVLSLPQLGIQDV